MIFCGVIWDRYYMSQLDVFSVCFSGQPMDPINLKKIKNSKNRTFGRRAFFRILRFSYAQFQIWDAGFHMKYTHRDAI